MWPYNMKGTQIDYLDDHMQANICVADDPKAFLASHIEQLKTARETGENFPCLFDESNVESAFGIMDPTGRGFITRIHYQEGSFDNILQ